MLVCIHTWLRENERKTKNKPWLQWGLWYQFDADKRGRCNQCQGASSWPHRLPLHMQGLLLSSLLQLCIRTSLPPALSPSTLLATPVFAIHTQTKLPFNHHKVDFLMGDDPPFTKQLRLQIPLEILENFSYPCYALSYVYLPLPKVILWDIWYNFGWIQSD